MGPDDTGLILGLRPANEKRRYKVTPSLIGWAQTYNQPRDSIWYLIYTDWHESDDYFLHILTSAS